MSYALIAGGHRADSLGPDGGTSGAADITGGDLIVAAVPTLNGVTLASGDLSDVFGNTSWVLAGGVTYAEPGEPRLHVFYHLAPVVGSGYMIAVTKSSSYCAIAFAAFSGSLASPYDGQDGGSASGTTVAPATGVTPSQDGDLLISALTDNDGGTITDPSGYTRTDRVAKVSGTSYAITLAYKVQTTAALEAPSWTAAGPVGLATQVVAFKQAAVALGQPAVLRAVQIPGLYGGGSLVSRGGGRFLG